MVGPDRWEEAEVGHALGTGLELSAIYRVAASRWSRNRVLIGASFGGQNVFPFRNSDSEPYDLVYTTRSFYAADAWYPCLYESDSGKFRFNGLLGASFSHWSLSARYRAARDDLPSVPNSTFRERQTDSVLALGLLLGFEAEMPLTSRWSFVVSGRWEANWARRPRNSFPVSPPEAPRATLNVHVPEVGVIGSF